MTIVFANGVPVHILIAGRIYAMASGAHAVLTYIGMVERGEVTGD